tara:strand:+ start:219 stop:395 length:177 start_codon:yes stop_codon:yes gene_type:complete
MNASILELDENGYAYNPNFECNPTELDIVEDAWQLAIQQAFELQNRLDIAEERLLDLS